MTAGEPPDGSGRRQRRGWWIAAGLLALLLAIGLVVLWVQAPALYGRSDAAKTAAATGATATTRAGILTLGVVIVAGLVAWVSLAETRRANAETQRANREADQRDRYAKAIEQLGSGKLDVQLGGIYGLERIAETSERDQRTIVEVLSAFVRNSSQPAASNRSPDNQPGIRPEEQPAPAALPAGDTRQSPPTDVQAALTVLGRLSSRPEVSQGDLSGAHLAGANLVKADLTRANLIGATLTDANLVAAILTGADLRDATLTGAGLEETILIDAKLRRAILICARLKEGANLTGADLAETDLTKAKNLTQQQLDSARGDENTKLPGGYSGRHTGQPPAAQPPDRPTSKGMSHVASRW